MIYSFIFHLNLNCFKGTLKFYWLCRLMKLNICSITRKLFFFIILISSSLFVEVCAQHQVTIICRDLHHLSFQESGFLIYLKLKQCEQKDSIYIYIYIYIYIVIHRQICFILSELISVARQYLPIAGIETRLTQTSTQASNHSATRRY